MLPFTKDELAKIDEWQRLRDVGYGGDEAESKKFSKAMTQMNQRRAVEKKRRKAVEKALRWRARHAAKWRKYHRKYGKIWMRAKRDAIKASTSVEADW